MGLWEAVRCRLALRRYRPINEAEWALLEPRLREREECTSLFVRYGLIRVPAGTDLESVRVREALGEHFPEHFPTLSDEEVAGLPPTLTLWTLAPHLLLTDALMEPQGNTQDAMRMRHFIAVERGEHNESRDHGQTRPQPG